MANKIQNRIFVMAPRSEVFKAVATSEGLSRWFVTTAVIEPRVGGHIALEWEEFGYDRGTIKDEGGVLSYEENSRFSFTWNPGESRTTVTFAFEEARGGTLVSLTDEGYTDSPQDFEALLACAVGWGEALLALKAFLEHGITLLEMRRRGQGAIIGNAAA